MAAWPPRLNCTALTYWSSRITLRTLGLVPTNTHKQREGALVPNVEQAALPPMQLAFPQIEQDLSKRLSLGLSWQEKLSVAQGFISVDDSDPYSRFPILCGPSIFPVIMLNCLLCPARTCFANVGCPSCLASFLERPHLCLPFLLGHLHSAPNSILKLIMS